MAIQTTHQWSNLNTAPPTTAEVGRKVTELSRRLQVLKRRRNYILVFLVIGFGLLATLGVQTLPRVEQAYVLSREQVIIFITGWFALILSTHADKQFHLTWLLATLVGISALTLENSVLNVIPFLVLLFPYLVRLETIIHDTKSSLQDHSPLPKSMADLILLCCRYNETSDGYRSVVAQMGRPLMLMEGQSILDGARSLSDHAATQRLANPAPLPTNNFLKGDQLVEN